MHDVVVSAVIGCHWDRSLSGGRGMRDEGRWKIMLIFQATNWNHKDAVWPLVCVGANCC